MLELGSGKISVLWTDVLLGLGACVAYVIVMCVIGIRLGYTTYGGYHRVQALLGIALMMVSILFNAQIDTLEKVQVAYDHVGNPLVLVVNELEGNGAFSVKMVGLSLEDNPALAKARDSLSALLHPGQSLTLKLMPGNVPSPRGTVEAYVFDGEKETNWKDEFSIKLVEDGLVARDPAAKHALKHVSSCQQMAELRAKKARVGLWSSE